MLCCLSVVWSFMEMWHALGSTDSFLLLLLVCDPFKNTDAWLLVQLNASYDFHSMFWSCLSCNGSKICLQCPLFSLAKVEILSSGRGSVKSWSHATLQGILISCRLSNICCDKLQLLLLWWKSPDKHRIPSSQSTSALNGFWRRLCELSFPDRASGLWQTWCVTSTSQSSCRSQFDTIEVIDSGKLIQKVNIPFDWTVYISSVLSGGRDHSNLCLAFFF